MGSKGVIHFIGQVGFLEIDNKQYTFDYSLECPLDEDEEGDVTHRFGIITNVVESKKSAENLYEEFGYFPLKNEHCLLLRKMDIRKLEEFYKKHPEYLSITELKDNPKFYPLIKNNFTAKQILAFLIEVPGQCGSGFRKFAMRNALENM